MNTSHETGGSRVAQTHDWLTPPDLLNVLGGFDLDPCASERQPWRTATVQYTVADDGLSKPWLGRVWCNPPYGPHAEAFLRRMAAHRCGTALIFARTDTKAFQRWVFGEATALLFLAGRIKFLRPDGIPAGRAGAPSVLVAYGERNAAVLAASGLGHFVRLAGGTLSHPA